MEHADSQTMQLYEKFLFFKLNELGIQYKSKSSLNYIDEREDLEDDNAEIHLSNKITGDSLFEVEIIDEADTRSKEFFAK